LIDRRYDRPGLIGDLIRAALALAVTGLPLVFLALHPVLLVMLGGTSLLFLWFLLRIIERLFTRISVTETALSIHGWRHRQLDWADLSDVRMRYYSTRRDRSNGWFQLILRGQGRQQLVLESGITDFDQLAEHVAWQAKDRGLRLDDATIENMLNIGVPYRLLAIKE
tara:strand:- start:1322 stop:1822 length:501 start_codon:yes stop_codon:yes gene_type:complete